MMAGSLSLAPPLFQIPSSACSPLSRTAQVGLLTLLHERLRIQQYRTLKLGEIVIESPPPPTDVYILFLCTLCRQGRCTDGDEPTAAAMARRGDLEMLVPVLITGVLALTMTAASEQEGIHVLSLPYGSLSNALPAGPNRVVFVTNTAPAKVGRARFRPTDLIL